MSSVFSSLWAVINYFYYYSSSHEIYVNLSNFSDKMFPALGFGAKLPDGTVSHEFFMVCWLYYFYCLVIKLRLILYWKALNVCQLIFPYWSLVTKSKHSPTFFPNTHRIYNKCNSIYSYKIIWALNACKH